MSIVKNYFYNIIYQVVQIIFPLITLPYITRTIGADGVGVFAYTNSILQYFVTFAQFAISIYASREIAYCKDDIQKRNRLFNEILTLQLFTSTTSLLLFLSFVLFAGNGYLVFFLIQSLAIISISIDISWYFIGTEDFKRNVTRNIIAKVISLIALFLFVFTPNDLWKYMLINVGSMLLAQVLMWRTIKGQITVRLSKLSRVKYHFIKNIKLFAIVLLGICSINLNKIILGTFMSKAVLGEYDIAYRLIYLILTFSAGLGSVMLPRISNTFSKGDNTKIISYLKMSMSFVYLTAIPMILGIYIFSEKFVKWFLGSHFIGTNSLMIFLSPMILINSISGVLAYQYMIPTGKEKKYIISLICGLVLSTVSAYVLIPKYSAAGACVVIIINEIAILFGHLIQLRSDKIIKSVFSEIGKYAVSGTAMTLLLYILLSIYGTNIFLVAFVFVLALIIYILFSFFLKTSSVQYIYSKLLLRSK